MNFPTTKNIRYGIMRALENGRGNYLGCLETEDEGVIELVTLGKLVIGGSFCNVGLLVDWNQIIQLEGSWQDPAESYVEVNEIALPC